MLNCNTVQHIKILALLHIPREVLFLCKTQQSDAHTNCINSKFKG